MKITVDNFEVDNDSILSFRTSVGLEERILTFSLPERFVPANDLIALAFTTLCGTKYDEIVFDLPISRKVRKSIEGITKSSVKAPLQDLPQSAPPSENYVLNFSGGFDSLAALAVMPDTVKLASMDFGGAFEREAKFFSRFETTTVKTNFRKEGFARNHWTFMGVAPILLRDYFKAHSYSFGSILEGSVWNLQRKRFANKAQPVFAAAGLRMFNPILGLTEMGAIQLLQHYSHGLAKASLESLAAPGSEKFKRKALLFDAIESLHSGGKISDIQMKNITPELKFGTNLPSDFRTLYMVKKFGIEVASLISEDIPKKVFEFTHKKSLNFYERLNPTFTQSWTTSEKIRVYSKCLDAGIDLYTEEDFEEYRECIEFLSQWHEGLI
ncbi:hypothetical protein [Glutamicibacter uratoxydans]|uniref:hypothetical protein n=1 Tax=Glutamicibacter uratoxydans TaxID=43667 RepID=UPI003D6E6369